MINSGNTFSLLRFFANPIVGVLGSIASIVGLVLAIYFYNESARHRELTYLVNPAKAIVLKASQTSRLNVTLDGKPINTDLTAAQIAFWNAGGEAIRAEHVLRPFVIHTGRDAPIIEATVRKRSRGVVSIALDTKDISMGDLGVSWNILEQSDGGVVQIIFAGVPESSIWATAVVEGQSELHKLSVVEKENSFWYREVPGWVVLALGWISIGIGIFMVIWIIAKLLRFQHKPGKGSIAILISFPILMIAMGVFILISIRPEPPFGF